MDFPGMPFYCIVNDPYDSCREESCSADLCQVGVKDQDQNSGCAENKNSGQQKAQEKSSLFPLSFSAVVLYPCLSFCRRFCTFFSWFFLAALTGPVCPARAASGCICILRRFSSPGFQVFPAGRFKGGIEVIRFADGIPCADLLIGQSSFLPESIIRDRSGIRGRI